MKLQYATNINGTNQTGLINLEAKPPVLFCICNKEEANLILAWQSTSQAYWDLNKKIASLYDNENSTNVDLTDVGAIVVTELGLMRN